MKKFVKVALAIALIACCVFTLVACGNKDGDDTTGDNANKTIRLSTTTSVNDSGLMDYLMPYFTADTGYTLAISSAGTGAAIKAAKDGNADVILVHSKSQEEAFVNDGFARKVEGYPTERVTFMHNYFVIVGPTADPANIKDSADPKAAFASIASTESKFISRGDQSGTHTKEVSLWHTSLGITADVSAIPIGLTSWYISKGDGMGACLSAANQENGYVLSDKATYLSFKNNSEGDKLPNLEILYEQGSDLKNTYSIIAVNPAAFDASVEINTAGADVFVKWMNSEHAKALIAFYGTTQYGEALFTLGV